MSAYEDEVQVPKEFTAREKMPTKVFKYAASANVYIAQEIAKLIQSGKKPVTLGLITGNTPIGVYKELVRLHHEEGLSFQNVVVFATGEFYPISKDQIQSTWSVLHDQLLSHVNIPHSNVHIPDGTVPKEQVDAHCKAYEEELNKLGLDILLMGVNGDGALAHNEPGSSTKSVTRCVTLDRKRRKDMAGDFFGLDAVPKMAITVGLSTILNAKRVFLMAFSETKANIIQRVVEGAKDQSLSLTVLQDHPATEAVVDQAASNALTRTVSPWVLLLPSQHHLVQWTPVMIRMAVIWLSLRLDKAILKLREDDYLNNHLESLVDAKGPVFELNKSVFSFLQSTITGWPGGRPNDALVQLTPPDRLTRLGLSDLATGTSTRNVSDYVGRSLNKVSHPTNPRVSSEIYPKTVLIFSPHPDDDVISMGGTMIRLIEQGHRVHVAYQTSGNIAVWDDDVKRFANFVTQFAKGFQLGDDVVAKVSDIENRIEEFFAQKKAGHPDNDDIRQVKGLIRETEARNAAIYCGAKKEDIHFLYLPFYETGEAKKKDLSDVDIKIVQDLIEKVQPHQIYAAGDLSDPHGTHRVCLMAIFAALQNVKEQEWFQQCQVWLYRGAWQEWEPHVIQMAVPMSPDELMQKRYAIYKHQSQKDPAPFPGSDPREFWQRTESRNRATAQIYDKLGLADYEAMEAFVEYDVHKPNEIPL